MARYRGELDEQRERELYSREARLRREGLGSYDEPYSSRRRFEEDRRPYYNRYGERAEYDNDEPRYGDGRDRYREDAARPALYEGRDVGGRYGREQASVRSRLRCRDIMTRDLAVATRGTTLREVALMKRASLSRVAS